MRDDAFVALAKCGDQEAIASVPERAGGCDENGVTALMWALYYGHPETAEHIASLRPVNLFEAAALGWVDPLQECLDQHPGEVDSRSPDGFTALGFACFFGKLDAARLLLNKGANPNLPSENAMGVAPLHSALAGGYLEVVHHLVNHGADVNLPSGEGWTPLHYAGDLGDEELVRFLRSRGAMCGLLNSLGVDAEGHARSVGHVTAADAMRD